MYAYIYIYIYTHTCVSKYTFQYICFVLDFSYLKKMIQ
jgi:hypothetical protein